MGAALATLIAVDPLYPEGNHHYYRCEGTAPVVIEVLKARGFKRWSAVLHGENWEVWMGIIPLTAYEFLRLQTSNPTGRHIGRVPFLQYLTSKAALARTLALVPDSRFGSLLPLTFILPDETETFTRAADATPGAVWICKPAAASRGIGIWLTRDPFEAIRRRAELVQRYMEPPATISGFKFDLRLYVVVRSLWPLEVAVCSAGVVRFASRRYGSRDATGVNGLRDLHRHLTNFAINCDDPSAERACLKAPLTELWTHLSALGINVDDIWTRAKHLCTLTVWGAVHRFAILSRHGSHPLWNHAFNCAGGGPCFQILGFDVLLERDTWSPRLVEVNLRPSLTDSDPSDRALKATMLHQALDYASVRDSREGPPRPQLETLWPRNDEEEALNSECVLSGCPSDAQLARWAASVADRCPI
jgi:tubulin polyglutamylase TTLL2